MTMGNPAITANGSYRRHSLNIVVPLELSEWLMLSQKAVQNNVALVIPAQQTIRGILHADAALPYVLIDAIQWDGVLSGQVSFEFMAGRQRVAGYAVQAIIQMELILSEKGQGIRYTFVNSQLTQAIVNIDYLSIQAHVVDNEIRPALDFAVIGGR